MITARFCSRRVVCIIVLLDCSSHFILYIFRIFRPSNWFHEIVFIFWLVIARIFVWICHLLFFFFRLLSHWFFFGMFLHVFLGLSLIFLKVLTVLNFLFRWFKSFICNSFYRLFWILSFFFINLFQEICSLKALHMRFLKNCFIHRFYGLIFFLVSVLTLAIVLVSSHADRLLLATFKGTIFI